jgi:protein-disulfide isomerase
MNVIARSALCVPVLALLAACGRGDASANAKPSTPERPATTASSNGVLAPPATTPTGARDSLTDRADRGRIMGDSTASTWLVIASDFQCPFCKRWHDEAFVPLVRDYVRTKRLRVAYLNFPLSQHQHAMPAAEAAMCASVQGKFWEMGDALFASQPKWEELATARPVFDSLAMRLGVAMPAWRDCMDKHSMVALIQSDRDRARAAGAPSTPTFFIANHMLVGAAPWPQFRDSIDAVLKASGTTKP